MKLDKNVKDEICNFVMFIIKDGIDIYKDNKILEKDELDIMTFLNEIDLIVKRGDSSQSILVFNG